MKAYAIDQDIRPVDWIRAARKVLKTFPVIVRDRVNTALTIAAEGSKADIAATLKRLDPDVMEIAVRYRTDAWSVVYAIEVTRRLCVIHAFRRDSRTGLKTPKAETNLVRCRLGRRRREWLP